MPLEAYLFCQKHLAVQLLYHFKASSWWILRSFKQYLGVLQIFTSRSLNHPKMEKNYPHLEENFTHTYVSPRSHPCKQHCALACLKGCISAIPKQTILGFARNLMKGKLVFYEISTVAVSFLKASSSIFSFVNWLTDATNFSSSLMAETNKSYKGPCTALHVEQKLIKYSL